MPTCGVVDPFAIAGDGEILKAVLCTYGDSVTVAGLIMVGWFTVASMSYIRTGSMAMPTVLTLLIGGASIASLPSVGLDIVGIALVGGGAVIVVLFLRRLDRI